MSVVQSTSPHASAEDIERYVTAELTGETAAAFERHVAKCDQCAAALAREAAFELSLAEIGRAAAEQPRSARAARPRGALRRLAVAGASVAAVAAFVVASASWIGAMADPRSVDPGALHDTSGADAGSVMLAFDAEPDK